MSTPKKVKFGKIELSVNQVDNEFIPTDNLHYVEDSTLLREIALCVYEEKGKKAVPILFEGPTGVGKTALVKFLAQKTNNGYRRIPINGATSVDDFVGHMAAKDGSTYWVDGVLTDALRKGYWLFCDELNAALPEVLFVLHSLLDDDNYIVLPQNNGEIVRPHPNFRLFAAQNPSEDYAGTKETNAALRNRFIVCEMDYPLPALEVKIILKHTGIKNVAPQGTNSGPVTRLVRVAANLRKEAKDGKIIGTPCTTRQLIRVSEFAKYAGWKKAAEMIILNNSDVEDREIVKVQINSEFSDTE